MAISVITLSWNELDVTKDSVRRLLKEPGVKEVIVVDNGSTDGTKEHFRSIAGRIFTPDKEYKEQAHNPKLMFIDWLENIGASAARNLAIKVSVGSDIFLIDGDILYVPGTLAVYSKILKHYKDAFCVGQNSFEMLAELGHNGTQESYEADLRMSDDYIISDWFPMSWCQYGLYRGELLRKTLFNQEGAFGMRGYGYEDDDHWHRMNELGYVSLAVNKPVYYHQAHTGIRELIRSQSKEVFDANMELRKQIFEKKWGRGSSWSEYLAKKKPEHTTRPVPKSLLK